jgi:hypothetical protein
MHREPDQELEQFIHRRLRELPEREAPAALIPRVLAVLEARARLPWWQLSWWDWPVAARATFVFLALALAALLGGGNWWLGENVNTYSQQVGERLAPVTNFYSLLAGWATALLGQVASLSPTTLVCLGTAATVLYLVSLGLGTVCFRVVTRRY